MTKLKFTLTTIVLFILFTLILLKHDPEVVEVPQSPVTLTTAASAEPRAENSDSGNRINKDTLFQLAVKLEESLEKYSQTYSGVLVQDNGIVIYLAENDDEQAQQTKLIAQSIAEDAYNAGKLHFQPVNFTKKELTAGADSISEMMSKSNPAMVQMSFTDIANNCITVYVKDAATAEQHLHQLVSPDLIHIVEAQIEIIDQYLQI